MFTFIFLFIFHKKLNKRLTDYKVLIPAIIVMIVYTIVCRIGFG